MVGMSWDGTAVGDSAEEFWLEQEVAETCAVDAYVRPFLCVFSVLGAIGSGCCGCLGRGFGLKRLLIFLVVDQVFVVVRGHSGRLFVRWQIRCVRSEDAVRQHLADGVGLKRLGKEISLNDYVNRS